MRQLEVLSPKDKLLRIKCSKVEIKDLRLNSTQKTITELIDFVYGTNNKGNNRDKNIPSTVGLSANQVGVNSSITVVDLGIGHKNYNDIHVLINPVIQWQSKSKLIRDEGCVNLDYIRGFVHRSARVKVEAFNRSGNKILLDLKGWPAILLQHEIDHLNGILFIDRLVDPKIAHLVKKGDLIEYKKIKQNWKKYTDVSGLVRPIKLYT